MSHEKHLARLIQEEGLPQDSVQAKYLLVIRHAENVRVKRIMGWTLYMVGENIEDKGSFLTTVGYRFANMSLSTRMTVEDIVRELSAAVGDLIDSEYLEEAMDTGGLHFEDKLVVRDALSRSKPEEQMMHWI